MYKNLKREMKLANIKIKDFARCLNVRYATVQEKLSGKYPFKLDEAMKIKESYFPDMSIEYLFGAEVPQVEKVG